MALYWLRMGRRAAPQLLASREMRPALAGIAAAAVHALVESSLRVPANAAWTLVLLVLAVSPTVEASSASRPRGTFGDASHSG